ncbi:MAG: nitroreductase [Lachnospiraceae bacterium]|nr:nitroreductase [Lachnospiraceae bacterium]
MSTNQTLETIFSRMSYRGAFKDTPVPREDLVTILKAGIAAPSGCNKQTTSFVAVDDEIVLNELKEIFSKPSCQSAPAWILVFTQEIVGVDGNYYHVQDYGAAMENMLLAIKSLGYETCWYEGNVRNCAEEIAEFVKAPEGCRLVCVLPVGIPSDELPPRKIKKAFEERAWFNKYGAK